MSCLYNSSVDPTGSRLYSSQLVLYLLYACGTVLWHWCVADRVYFTLPFDVHETTVLIAMSSAPTALRYKTRFSNVVDFECVGRQNKLQISYNGTILMSLYTMNRSKDCDRLDRVRQSRTTQGRTQSPSIFNTFGASQSQESPGNDVVKPFVQGVHEVALGPLASDWSGQRVHRPFLLMKWLLRQ